MPIVMAVSGDPIGAGLAASLVRPGGNVTGLSLALPDMAGKHVELLLTMVPHAKRIAILTNPHDPTHAGRAEAIKGAARSVGVAPFTVAALTVDRIDGAFTEMTRQNADALIVLGTPLFASANTVIVALAARHRLPALYDASGFVPVGGLISYSADITDLFRRAATFVDKILNGAKPADLPIEQPTRFQLLINLKTAAALGLTVPQSLLQRADEVIE